MSSSVFDASAVLAVLNADFADGDTGLKRFLEHFAVSISIQMSIDIYVRSARRKVGRSTGRLSPTEVASSLRSPRRRPPRLAIAVRCVCEITSVRWRDAFTDLGRILLCAPRSPAASRTTGRIARCQQTGNCVSAFFFKNPIFILAPAVNRDRGTFAQVAKVRFPALAWPPCRRTVSVQVTRLTPILGDRPEARPAECTKRSSSST